MKKVIIILIVLIASSVLLKKYLFPDDEIEARDYTVNITNDARDTSVWNLSIIYQNKRDDEKLLQGNIYLGKNQTNLIYTNVPIVRFVCKGEGNKDIKGSDLTHVISKNVSLIYKSDPFGKKFWIEEGKFE